MTVRNYELIVMYVRRFDSSRHLCFLLLLVIRIYTNANYSHPETKHFLYLLDNEPIFELLNEPGNTFNNNVVSKFEERFHTEIEMGFSKCTRKGVANIMYEFLDTTGNSTEPVGALVTDCVVACELGSGFFPMLGVAVISSGCATVRSHENSVDESIVRMKASWHSWAKPLHLFLNHFHWKTIAIICSYKAGLNMAAELIGGTLRSNGIAVYVHDVAQEYDVSGTASDINKDARMTSVLTAAGEYNNSKYRLTP